MRLRLWWHLCVLDSRAPEDQGFQPAVDVRNNELRLPLNLNDDQIYPDMARLPAASEGWTEMSFFLIQAESCRLVRPIVDAQGRQCTDSLLEIREKKKIIKDEKYFQDKFGVSSRSEALTDLQRITMQHVSTACKKMLFVLQLREEIITRKQKEAIDANPNALKHSFKLACDALESSHVLLKGGLASRFNWFFNMYTQCYALAYVLRCICSSIGGPEIERLWFLVEELFPRELSFPGHPVGVHDGFNQGSIWSYLDMLRHQALSVRQHARPPVSTADIVTQPFSNGSHYTSQALPDAGITALSGSTATANGISTFSEMGREVMSNSSQSGFSFPDLSMPDIPFLPDWNAVINGCLQDGDHEPYYSYSM